MHSPDPSPRKKPTTLKDKKSQLSLLLFKGSLMVSPKSTYQTSATQSEIKVANRFDPHSATKSKTKPALAPQILHEARTSRYPKYNGLNFGFGGDPSKDVDALLSPRYKKTNPITQNGDEAVHEWKPTAKKTSNSYKTTLFTAEEKPRGLAKGKFSNNGGNPLKNDDHPIPEPVGIKTYNYGATTVSPDVPVKRQLRGVATSPERNKPNPILVGEDSPVKQRVVEQQVSDWAKKTSDRKAFLPCDRVNSPTREHLHKPTAVKSILDHESNMLNRRTSAPVEIHAELKRRKSGTIGDLLTQTQLSDSKFRVSPKVQESEFKTLQANRNTDKTFARTRTDFH